MIAITTHHQRHVVVMVAAEILTVVIGALGFFPLVEHFVNHQESQTVTSIEECLGGQIVAATHGIISLRLHEFHLSDVGTVNACGSEQTVVVMDTASVEFEAFAVEFETFFGRKTEGSDAKGNEKGIFFFSRLAEIDFSGVAVRIVERPKGWRRNFYLGCHIHSVCRVATHFETMLSMPYDCTLYIQNIYTKGA